MTNETTATTTPVLSEIFETFSPQAVHEHGFHGFVYDWLTKQGLSFLSDMLSAIVIFLVGWLVIRIIGSLIGRAISKSAGHRALLGNFVRSVTSKLAWTLLTVIILSRLGINIAPIIAGLGVSGFILGFAFQESLSNLAAGLMIAFNEPFKIGDYVIVAGFEGSVRKMDMIATKLVTSDNKTIIVANKSVWSSPITNFTALGCRRVDIPIGISYACDVTKAIKVAVETLPTVAGVLNNPPPDVIVASLGDSQVTLNVRPWTRGLDFWAVRSNTQIAIKAAFEKNGISIPFPQLDVHMDR